MHEFFEAQCDRTPDAVAVRFGDAALSTPSWTARANRIAHLLRARGVRARRAGGPVPGPRRRHGRGLLGMLKAGAGYVPLDPAFPADRLAFMVGDAGSAALLTQREHAGTFDLRGRRC